LWPVAVIVILILSPSAIMASLSNRNVAEAETEEEKGKDDIVHFDPDSEPSRISLRLALEGSIPKVELGDYETLSGEAILDLVASLKSVHLEWRNILEIRNLEPFDRCESLYLQYNRIRRIENLDALNNLTFLALQANQIERVEHIRHLRKLEFLDLSQNRISALDPMELPPPCLFILNLKGNPVSDAGGYSAEVLMQWLPNLVTLDGVDLYPEEEEEEEEEKEEGVEGKEKQRGERGRAAAVSSSADPSRYGSAAIGNSGEDTEDEFRFARAEREAWQKQLEADMFKQIGAYSAEVQADEKDTFGDARGRIRQRTQVRQDRQKERNEQRQKELDAEKAQMADRIEALQGSNSNSNSSGAAAVAALSLWVEEGEEDMAEVSTTTGEGGSVAAATDADADVAGTSFERSDSCC